MTLRERFYTIMEYKEVDRLPYIMRMELNLRSYHRSRWVQQGMPKDCNPYAFFGYDEAENERATMWLDRGRGVQYIEVDANSWPRFEARPPRREGDFEYIYDVRGGSLHKRLLPRTGKDIRVKMIAEYPVNNYEEWLEYKKRYQPYDPERYPRMHPIPHWPHPFPRNYPENWEEVAEDTKKADHLVTITISDGFGNIGMDFEQYVLLFVDNPDWVQEMNDHWGWFNREVRRRAVETARIDFLGISGPARGRNGDLMFSPKMYFEHAEEDNRKNFTMASENGIKYLEMPDLRHYECEEKFIGMAQDAGLTPILHADGEGEFKVAARRKQYGKQFPIWAGMDLRELLDGKKAIDSMIDRVFSDAEEGGYFPYLDDRFGSGYQVSFELFEYYTKAFRRSNGM